jgi:hypothetical protein
MGGVVLTPVGGYATAYGIALQTDGKLIAAGSAYVGDNEFVVMRYDTTDTSILRLGRTVLSRPVLAATTRPSESPCSRTARS